MSCFKLIRQMPCYNTVAAYLRPITKLPGYSTAANTVSKYPGEAISVLGLGIAYWAKSYQLAFIPALYLTYRVCTSFSGKQMSKSANSAIRTAGSAQPKGTVGPGALAAHGQTRTRTSAAQAGGSALRFATNAGATAGSKADKQDGKAAAAATDASPMKATSSAQLGSPAGGKPAKHTVSFAPLPNPEEEGSSALASRQPAQYRKRAGTKTDTDKDALPLQAARKRSGTVDSSADTESESPAATALPAAAITHKGLRVIVENQSHLQQPQDTGNWFSRPSGAVGGDPANWSDT